MSGNYSAPCRRAFVAASLLIAAAAAACDDDPNAPGTGALELTVVNTDTIGRQEAIRVVFNRPVSPQTAVDPANFVVTNLCTGLRIEGALRLSATGDTLTFTPSSPLPFLTRVGVRVQNVLDAQGVSFANPVTFTRITQRPPVSDISWAFLDSPTNDFITGVHFVNRQVGFIATFSGQVFRTENGGVNFGARFKDPNISFAADLHTFGPDTLFMVATQIAGGPVVGRLLRSVDGGLTFPVAIQVPGFPTAMQIRRTGPGQFIAAIGGQFTGPVVSQWNSVTGNVTQATGLTTNALFTNVVLSPNAQHAVVTLRVGAGDQLGEAFRSTDGGLSYAPITLPAGVFGLDGAGFINNTTALVLGDSSTVLRVNTATGAVVQLGAAQGIPQKTLDPTTGAVTTFSFIKADFAPNSNIGWVVGSSTVKQPGRSDIVRGVILMSRDGGLTFTRQAIAGAPDNGLGFSDPLEVHALAPDFAALGGTGGVLAARTADTPGNLTECSFTNP